MTIRRKIYLGIVSVVIVFAYFAWKLTARSAYESAEYTVLESDSQFETREYPDLQTLCSQACLQPNYAAPFFQVAGLIDSSPLKLCFIRILI